MSDERAVEVVSQALKETSWTSHPFPAEYVPALARDILYALEQAGLTVWNAERLEAAHVQRVWLGTWLEQILHVHFHASMEWETVQRWIDDPKSFDIFGEPFREAK